MSLILIKLVLFRNLNIGDLKMQQKLALGVKFQTCFIQVYFTFCRPQNFIFYKIIFG